MSNLLPDSEVVIQDKCPTCWPDEDVRRYVPRYCEEHMPAREGEDDRLVDTTMYLSGNADVGGDNNRAWCAFVHRERK